MGAGNRQYSWLFWRKNSTLFLIFKFLYIPPLLYEYFFINYADFTGLHRPWLNGRGKYIFFNLYHFVVDVFCGNVEKIGSHFRSAVRSTGFRRGWGRASCLRRHLSTLNHQRYLKLRILFTFPPKNQSPLVYIYIIRDCGNSYFFCVSNFPTLNLSIKLWLSPGYGSPGRKSFAKSSQ